MDKLGAKALDVCIRHGLLEDVSLHYMLPEDRLNECHGLRILCRFGLPAVPGPCTCIHSASVWLDAGRPPYRLGLFDSMCPVRCESRAFRKRSSRTYVKRLGEASLQREDIPYMWHRSRRETKTRRDTSTFKLSHNCERATFKVTSDMSK